MEFLTFHVSLNKSAQVHPNQTLQHDQYLSMIDMMAASARLHHKNARVVVLSDQATSFEACRAKLDGIERFDMYSSKLMFERTKAQCHYIQASSFASPLVVIDSDILVNAPLKDLFKRDFDVAVTWRENKIQPINGGLLILNNRRPEVVKAFFRKFLAIYETQYAQQGAWFGDQLALRDAVGRSLKQLKAKELVEVDGCRILMLPCDTYNFSPDNRFAEVAAYRSDKVILHFKGERKRLMGPYWQAWLRPRSASILARLQALAERRRITRHIRSEARLPAPTLIDEEAS